MRLRLRRPGEQPKADKAKGSGALLGLTVGAALAYFMDPDAGARRRNILRDRSSAIARRLSTLGTREARRVAADAAGTAQKIKHLRPVERDHDDVTLARKVETELFRDQEIDKGRLNVNVEHGCVVLRGEVEHPDDVNDIERRVRAIAGVYEVKNLLHLPGTPAPHA